MLLSFHLHLPLFSHFHLFDFSLKTFKFVLSVLNYYFALINTVSFSFFSPFACLSPVFAFCHPRIIRLCLNMFPPVCDCRAPLSPAGFIKCPLSQMKLTGDSVELHCEVIGTPIPEVQWWFVEGEEPNETFTQLFDGARGERVQVNATYIAHATSTIHITSLNLNDSGMYECRASNDPDRNELKKTPKIKWIRSQANIVVMESEWQQKREEKQLSSLLLVSRVLDIQLLFMSPVRPLSPQYTCSLSSEAPQLFSDRNPTMSL